MKCEKIGRINPGSPIPRGFIETKITVLKQDPIWNGHARTDGNRQDPTLTIKKQYFDKGWKVCLIKQIDSFTERNREAGKEVQINLNQQKIAAVVHLEKNELRIITRPANQLESKIHSRFPLYVDSIDDAANKIRPYLGTQKHFLLDVD